MVGPERMKIPPPTRRYTMPRFKGIIGRHSHRGSHAIYVPRPDAVAALIRLTKICPYGKVRNLMKPSMRALLTAAAILILSLTTATIGWPQARPTIQDRFASVGGVKLHYLVAGKGEPVILLHGYAENSHMWRALMAQLAK